MGSVRNLPTRYIQCDNLPGIKMSYEQAVEVANKTVHETLGYNRWDIAVSASERYLPNNIDMTDWYMLYKKTNDDMPRRYMFIYTDTIDGIPLLYYSYNQEVAGGVGLIWQQQCVCVTVDDTGVYSVYEQSSLSIDKQLTSNVSLISFDKVQEIFRDYILMHANYDTSYEEIPEDNPNMTTININNIRLGYVRIKEKDASETTGLLVPVWIFYGEQVCSYNDKNDCCYETDANNKRVVNDIGCPFLCINAIDGSIIDLSQGY